MKTKYITYNQWRKLESMEKYPQQINWLITGICIFLGVLIIITPFTPNLLLGAMLFKVYQKWGRK